MRIQLTHGNITDTDTIDLLFGQLVAHFKKYPRPRASYSSPFSLFSFLTKLSKSDDLIEIEVKPTYILIKNKEEHFVYGATDFDTLTKLSLGTKTIICFPSFDMPEPYVKVRSRPQLLYNCRDLVDKINEDLEKRTTNILSKRSRKTLAKNIRECKLKPMDWKHKEAVLTLFERWESEKRQKGLPANIRKDKALLPFLFEPQKYGWHSYIGYRDSHPVSITAFSQFDQTQGIHHLAKSLNYSSQPGGYNETSIWELYQTCMKCIETGIEWLNVSGYDNVNLKHHKEKFSINSKSFTLHDWTLLNQK